MTTTVSGSAHRATQTLRQGKAFRCQRRLTHTMVAGWPVSAEIDTTGWPPGFYLVHAIANNKRTGFRSSFGRHLQMVPSR